MAGATFAFEAIDLTGIPTKGEMEADSKAQVSEQLRQRGLTCTPRSILALLRRKPLLRSLAAHSTITLATIMRIAAFPK